MQPAICIPMDRYGDANDYFAALRKKQARLRGSGALRTVLFWWALSLLVLFVLFGYLRPAPDGQGSLTSAAWAFRDYVGRVVGAVPTDCAVVEPSSKYLSASKPLFMAWTSDDAPCAWRSDWRSLVVAFSPDVSPIQKITLFVLILGLIWLRQQTIERKIDLISFPRNDRELDEDRTKRDQGWSEHPVSRLDDPKRPAPQRLYPTNLIVLDPVWDEKGVTHLLRERLVRVSTLLSREKLNGPIDLLIDILETGAAHGTVGPASQRMRAAAFEFKEKVLGRLWPVDYLLWLLPTIGFVGTIYGISMSLASTKGLFKSQSAFDEEIAKVVDGLGVAFDTTAMALVCAAVLYLLLKRLEASAADLASAAEESLANLFIGRMADRVPVVPQPTVIASVAQTSADTDPTTRSLDGPKP